MSFSVAGIPDDELGAAIDRALSGSSLPAGDSLGGTNGIIVIDVDPSAIELGDAGAALDGDADGN